MNYKMETSTETDIPKLIEYKLKNIFEYADELSNEEINKIKNYVKRHIPMQLNNYKVICINNTKVGCLLVENKEDGVLLDEIYLENDYRNNGIGTDIISKVISKNKTVYLWVYKQNKKALSLYIRLGFKVIEETDIRYYMKYCN